MSKKKSGWECILLGCKYKVWKDTESLPYEHYRDQISKCERCGNKTRRTTLNK